MTNRFAGFGDNGGMPVVEKYTPAVSRIARPKNPTQPKSRLAHSEPIDDEIGEPAETRKGNNIMTDINRGPFHAMIEKQARARQAVTGESFAKAFTECYIAPENASIRDMDRYEHLAKQQDAMHGSRLSMLPAQKAVPADAKQDFVERAVESRGPVHMKLHEMAIEHSRAHGLSYQQSYTRLFTAPENVALRAGIAAEDGIRTLTIEEAMALAPTKPFPPYTAPGHAGEASNMGRSGRKPVGYIGG